MPHQSEHNDTLLLKALEDQDSAQLESWLHAGGALDALVKTPKEDTLSALHLLAQRPFWAPWLLKNAGTFQAQGVNIDAPLRQASRSPLAEACAVGNVQGALALLQAGANPNGNGEAQGGPLHWCPDHLKLLEALVAAGADVNLPNRFHKTPLRQWVDNKHSVRFVRRALQLGANPCVRCQLDETPLLAAMNLNLEGLARELIHAGATLADLSPTIEREQGQKPLTDAQWAAVVAEQPVHALRQWIGELSSSDVDARNRLLLLLRLDPTATKVALQKPAPNQPADCVNLDLEQACRHGHWQITGVLLRAGASIRGQLNDPYHVGEPLSRLGVLGVCLAGIAQGDWSSATPSENWRCAALVAREAMGSPDLWEAWRQSLFATHGDSGNVSDAAREGFNYLYAAFESQALEMDAQLQKVARTIDAKVRSPVRERGHSPARRL